MLSLLLHAAHKRTPIECVHKLTPTQHLLPNLPRELEQHRVVEELVDGDILRQSLPPPGLHHELARKMRGGLRLERAESDVLVQWVTRDNGPMIERRQTESLALSDRGAWLGQCEHCDQSQC